MTDVYHEDFRDGIALDVRIKAISDASGLSFSSYTAHESFYLDVAKDAYCIVIGMKAEIRPTHNPEPESAPGIDMPVPGALVDKPGAETPVNN